MKYLDTMEEGGYPFDDVSIDYLQKMHNDRDMFIHAIVGDLKILKGVVLDTQTNLYSDGLITVGEKMYHFVGGSPNLKISKQTIATKRQYEDGNIKKAYINEFYEFGETGTDIIDFSSLERVKNLFEIINDESVVNKQSNWNQDDSDAMDFIRNKPKLLTKRVYGTAALGDIGDTSNSNPTVTGDIISSELLYVGGGDERIKLNFDSIGTSNYVPNVALVSKGSNFDSDNDVILTLKNLTPTSFEILLREVGSQIQNLELRVQIIV